MALNESGTIRFALVDDDNNTIEIIASSLVSALKSNGYDCIYQKYTSPKTFLSNFSTYPLDILFCDIEMPELDGIELIKQIPEEKRPDVIFVSNREDRVFEALQLHPLGFIRKKKFLEDVNSVINNYFEQRAKKTSYSLVVKGRNINGADKVSIDIDKIIFIESDLKKQNIYLSNVDKPMTVEMTMSRLEEALCNNGFLRCHNAYIVNYLYIFSIQSNSIKMKNGKEIFLSRRKSKEVKSKYLELIKQKERFIL